MLCLKISVAVFLIGAIKSDGISRGFSQQDQGFNQGGSRDFSGGIDTGYGAPQSRDVISSFGGHSGASFEGNFGGSRSFGDISGGSRSYGGSTGRSNTIRVISGGSGSFRGHSGGSRSFGGYSGGSRSFGGNSGRPRSVTVISGGHSGGSRSFGGHSGGLRSFGGSKSFGGRSGGSRSVISHSGSSRSFGSHSSSSKSSGDQLNFNNFNIPAVRTVLRHPGGGIISAGSGDGGSRSGGYSQPKESSILRGISSQGGFGGSGQTIHTRSYSSPRREQAVVIRSGGFGGSNFGGSGGYSGGSSLGRQNFGGFQGENGGYGGRSNSW